MRQGTGKANTIFVKIITLKVYCISQILACQGASMERMLFWIGVFYKLRMRNQVFLQILKMFISVVNYGDKKRFFKKEPVIIIVYQNWYYDHDARQFLPLPVVFFYIFIASVFVGFVGKDIVYAIKVNLAVF